MNVFLAQVAKHRPLLKEGFRVLAFDPGETTGVCIFQGSVLKAVEQLSTGLMPMAAVTLCNYVQQFKPDIVVAEDYKVYKWKTDSHAWAELHTPRLIGALEYYLYTQSIPLIKQSAQVGKGFCTDDRLKEWGFYSPAKRHAMDAIRHACQFLMFGAKIG